tara:strand:- start:219 stop:698 length:480 start_codon:yes stop_codon:yes gene_type:complete
MSYIADKIIKNPKAIITTHTSQQTSSSSANTAIILSGSEITYTPDISASKVVYEIMFYSEIINNNGFISLELQHYVSNTWSEINARFNKNMGLAGGSQNMRYCNTYRYVLPTWTGARQLRIAMASHDDNRVIKFHKLTNWDGSTATDQFCNTNLLVYSI